MRYLLLTLTLLLTFSACTDDSAKHETKIANITKEAEAKQEILRAEIQEKSAALKKAQLETKLAKEELQAQKKLLVETHKKKELEQTRSTKDEKLSKLGISIKDSSITIDTNKTKDFFENIGKQLGEKLKKVTQEIQEGSLIERDAGIQIDESHINIDLNKTKDFLQEWGTKMQGFIKEFDTMAQELSIESLEINNTK